MVTWTLIMIFSWSVPLPVGTGLAHSGFSAPGFQSRDACKTAGEIIAQADARWACVPSMVIS